MRLTSDRVLEIASRFPDTEDKVKEINTVLDELDKVNQYRDKINAEYMKLCGRATAMEADIQWKCPHSYGKQVLWGDVCEICGYLDIKLRIYGCKVEVECE